MRGEVHILVYCPIDTLQWGSTHSALAVFDLEQHLDNIHIIVQLEVRKSHKGSCPECRPPLYMGKSKVNISLMLILSKPQIHRSGVDANYVLHNSSFPQDLQSLAKEKSQFEDCFQNSVHTVKWPFHCHLDRTFHQPGLSQHKEFHLLKQRLPKA